MNLVRIFATGSQEKYKTINEMAQVDIVIVCTYKCNFRCTYCDTIKKDLSASSEIYKKLAKLIIIDKNKRFSVKFFGGEPLLFFEEIKEFVNEIGQKKKIKYYLTTNGEFLDEEKLEFFLKNNFELAVSIDGDFKDFKKNRIALSGLEKKTFNKLLSIKKKYKKNIIVNMVIASSNVKNFYNNFIFLTSKGFLKINFLPATYHKWSLAQLKKLDYEFKRIASYLRRNNDEYVYIKNKDISNDIFFFSKALVVDSNGDIFFNNSILLNKFAHLRKDLYITNLERENSLEDVLKKYKFNEKMKIKYERSNKYIESISKNSVKTEIILNNFISLI